MAQNFILVVQNGKTLVQNNETSFKLIGCCNGTHPSGTLTCFRKKEECGGVL